MFKSKSEFPRLQPNPTVYPTLHRFLKSHVILRQTVRSNPKPDPNNYL